MQKSELNQTMINLTTSIKHFSSLTRAPGATRIEAITARMKDEL